MKGAFINHGAAPYQRQEGNSKATSSRSRPTLASELCGWGLELAMQNAKAQPRKVVEMVDRRTVLVVIQVIAEDRNVSDRTTQRRE